MRFILRGSLQQLTSGFYEGLKLKWEILTTARLNGTINRNFNSFYGKFRGHISFCLLAIFFTSRASIWKIFSLVCQLHFYSTVNLENTLEIHHTFMFSTSV